MTRQEWNAKERAQQVVALGARPYENLHHAIELQVLDEYPGAFTPAELTEIENIRVIPLEVTPAEEELLKIARSTPVEKWTHELADKVRMAAVKQPDGSELQMPVLKERGPKGRPVELHQAEIRRAWDKIYDDIDAQVAARNLKEGTPAWRQFVREELLAGRAYLDYRLDAFWGETKRGRGLR